MMGSLRLRHEASDYPESIVLKRRTNSRASSLQLNSSMTNQPEGRRRRFAYLIVVVVIVAVIVATVGYASLASQSSSRPGCGSGNCVTSSSNSTESASVQTAVDGFNLTVTVGNASPRIGDAVPIQIALTDVSNSTAYPDDCAVNLITVKNQSGSIVDGLAYEVIIDTTTASTSADGIGQNKVIDQSWNVTSQSGLAPVVPGVYFIDVSQCFMDDSGGVTTISAQTIQVQVSG